jgi:putative transposase
MSALDIMVVQIDGIHIRDQFVLVAALGIDSQGVKHPLGLMEGATEHSAEVRCGAGVDRRADRARPRSSGAASVHIDGSKALNTGSGAASGATRRSSAARSIMPNSGLGQFGQ